MLYMENFSDNNENLQISQKTQAPPSAFSPAKPVIFRSEPQSGMKGVYNKRKPLTRPEFQAGIIQIIYSRLKY